MHDELQRLIAAEDRAATSLIANRSARGAALSARGRASLVARIRQAATRSTWILGEQNQALSNVAIHDRAHRNARLRAAAGS